MKQLISLLIALAFFAGAATAEEKEIKYKAGGGLMFGTHVDELAINLGIYKTGAEELGFLSFLESFSESAMIGGDINYFLTDSAPGISTSFITFNFNVLPALTVMSDFDIYGIGGINIQRFSVETDFGGFGSFSDSSTDFGINGGAGASKDIGFADLFGEAKRTLGTESQIVLGGGLRKGF